MIELLEELETLPCCDTYQGQADHLIANGVTVQRWVPVSERLPERERRNFNEYLVCVCSSRWPTSSYDSVDAPYSEEYITSANQPCTECNHYADEMEWVKQKHGRWINERELAGGFRCEWGYDCSECGHTEVNRKPKYCPNCGAKMDGEA